MKRQVMCSETIISKGLINHAFVLAGNLSYSGIFIIVWRNLKIATLMFEIDE